MRFLDGGNHVNPVLRLWLRSWATAPCALEDFVQQQHRHVAADTIALFGDVRNSSHCRFPKPWLKRIHLQDILPSREVRISPTRKNTFSYHGVRNGIVPDIVKIPSNKVFGMLADPRMIQREMVGNKIEQQAEAPPGKFLTGAGQTLRATEALIDYIAPDAVGRSYIVFWLEIRKCSTEITHQVSLRLEIAMLVGLRSQTPMNQTASKPNAVIASHSVSGTEPRSTGSPFFRLSSAGQNPRVDLIQSGISRQDRQGVWSQAAPAGLMTPRGATSGSMRGAKRSVNTGPRIAVVSTSTSITLSNLPSTSR